MCSVQPWNKQHNLAYVSPTQLLHWLVLPVSDGFWRFFFHIFYFCLILFFFSYQFRSAVQCLRSHLIADHKGCSWRLLLLARANFLFAPFSFTLPYFCFLKWFSLHRLDHCLQVFDWTLEFRIAVTCCSNTCHMPLLNWVFPLWKYAFSVSSLSLACLANNCPLCHLRDPKSILIFMLWLEFIAFVENILWVSVNILKMIAFRSHILLKSLLVIAYITQNFDLFLEIFCTKCLILMKICWIWGKNLNFPLIMRNNAILFMGA